MRIISVTLKGFRSFHDETKWVLPDSPGLYLLWGRNEVDRQLQSNASGKTSIVESIVWCLYGKTTRGLRGGDIATWWGDGKVRVSVEFERRGKKHVVCRTVKPNRLTLDGVNVEPDVVTQAVGVNYECFLFSAVIGQFSKYFLDLGPTDKLSLFSFVLNLDYWIGRSEKAKADYEDAKEQEDEQERVIAGLEGRREEISDQLASLEVDIRGYDKQRKSKLKVMSKQLKELVANRGRQDTILADSKRARSKCQRVLDGLLVSESDERRALEKAMEELADCKAAVEVLSDKIHGILGDISEVSKSAPFCHSCRQKVTKGHVREEIARLRRKSKAVKAKKHQALDNESEAAAVVSDCKDRLRRLRVNIEKHQRFLDNAEREVRNYKEALRSMDAEIVDAQQEYKMLRKEHNPYEKQYQRSEKALKKLGDELRKEKQELRIVRQRAVDKKYWVKGFAELRLWVIQEVLRELEVETSNALSSLGLHGWGMTFSIERETKAGTISRGLQVWVTPPGAESAIRLDAYSGGEGQRLKIAGSIGVMNLIAQRRGLELQFEVWDEPTIHVNASGIDDLLQFYRDRSRLEEKVILFVDQHVLDAGAFDDVFTVVKNDEGSHLETAA